MAINFLSKSPRFGASYAGGSTIVRRQNIVVQFLTDEYRFPPGKAQSIQEVMEEQKRQGISHPTETKVANDQMLFRAAYRYLTAARDEERRALSKRKGQPGIVIRWLKEAGIQTWSDLDLDREEIAALREQVAALQKQLAALQEETRIMAMLPTWNRVFRHPFVYREKFKQVYLELGEDERQGVVRALELFSSEGARAPLLETMNIPDLPNIIRWGGINQLAKELGSNKSTPQGSRFSRAFSDWYFVWTVQQMEISVFTLFQKEVQAEE